MKLKRVFLLLDSTTIVFQVFYGPGIVLQTSDAVHVTLPPLHTAQVHNAQSSAQPLSLNIVASYNFCVSYC